MGHLTVLNVWFLTNLVCGILAGLIAGRKDRSPSGFALVGLIFGVVGLAVTALAPKGEPVTPVGMQAIQCVRCNAVTNVSLGQPQLKCWQCKRVIRV
jgi:MFS family permease